MSVYYIGTGDPDGMTVGRATTEKISFYGVTPIVQRAGSAQATLSTTISNNSSIAFASTAGFQALLNQVEEIRAALVAYGLFKGSA